MLSWVLNDFFEFKSVSFLGKYLRHLYHIIHQDRNALQRTLSECKTRYYSRDKERFSMLRSTSCDNKAVKIDKAIQVYGIIFEMYLSESPITPAQLQELITIFNDMVYKAIGLKKDEVQWAPDDKQSRVEALSKGITIFIQSMVRYRGVPSVKEFIQAFPVEPSPAEQEKKIKELEEEVKRLRAEKYTAELEAKKKDAYCAMVQRTLGSVQQPRQRTLSAPKPAVFCIEDEVEDYDDEEDVDDETFLYYLKHYRAIGKLK